MLNKLWGYLLIVAIICAICTNKISATCNAIFTGATNAVSLIITLMGGMCFWCGIMRIAQSAGFAKAIAKLFSPILSKLFYKIDKNSPEMSAIAMNISANLLGMGNAATPFGIIAMKKLKEKNPTDTADKNMIIFVIMNTASLQLIPTTIANLRASYGSSNPFDIIFLIWLSSFTALFCGVTGAKIFLKNHKIRR